MHVSTGCVVVSKLDCYQVMHSRTVFIFSSFFFIILYPYFALGQETTDIIRDSCSSPTAKRQITELSVRYAYNKFPVAQQNIGEFSGTHTICSDIDFIDRYRAELNGAIVDEEGRLNYQGLIGIGFDFFNEALPQSKGSSNLPEIALAQPDRLDLFGTVLGRVGYADFEVGDKQTIIGGALQFGFSSDIFERKVKTNVRHIERKEKGITVNRSLSGPYSVPTTQLVGSARIEYTRFSTKLALGQNQRVADNVLNTNVELAVDNAIFRDSGDWRWRLGLGNRYTDEDVPWNSIFSLSFSLRPVNDDHSDYPWATEISARKGNDFEAIQIGIQRRF